MQSIVASIKENDVVSPLRLLLNERAKQRDCGRTRFHSIYRDILFLSFVALGRDCIDHGLSLLFLSLKFVISLIIFFSNKPDVSIIAVFQLWLTFALYFLLVLAAFHYLLVLSGAPAATFDNYSMPRTTWSESSARARVAPTPGRCFTRYTGFW